MTFRATDILALIESPDNVGDNWRIVRPFLRLRQAGVNARYAWGDETAVPTDPETTVLVARMLSATDYCTIDRWLAERRKSVKAILYEVDDIFYGPGMVDHLEAADFMRGKTREDVLGDGDRAFYFASKCDGIVVSSEPLAEMLRHDMPGQVVAVVPNAIDVRWFRAQMAYRAPWADHLTIGWCGGRRPEADIVPMADAWGRIAKRSPHVRFVVAAPDPLPRVILDAVPADQLITFPWVSYGDSPVLYQTDIGCCAVSDTPFNRAKTPIKAWEYALAGAAVVATPTLYQGCVDRRGFLAESAEWWEASLEGLLKSAEQREACRSDLVWHVTKRHNLDTQLARWTEAYQQIVEASAVPA